MARYTHQELTAMELTQLDKRTQPECPPAGPSIGGRAATGYIWLAYSIFFFIDPVLRHSLKYWVECVAIYAVFLAVYVSYLKTRNARWRLIGVIAFYAIGLLTYPINSGATAFFIYSGAFLPFAVESVAMVRIILVAQSLGVVAEGLWLHSYPIGVAATVFFIVVVGSANTFIAQQKRADAKLRMAHAEIEQLAALAERERIARDLHDVLGHTLSVIVLKAELAGRLIERDPERAAREMADVETTARTALAEVREAIGGYRAKGLAAELEQARNTLNAAGVALACESPIPKLSAAEETVLSLAVREAVTNIVRHARAMHCRMRFETTADGFHSLLVEDDGMGYSPTAQAGLGREGNGLRGMRERVQSLGGRFSISSGQGVVAPGTTLVIELPAVTS
jgi:two-component system, NarL family, sensor histidine kinase DesK